VRKCEKRVEVTPGVVIGEALILSQIDGMRASSSHWRIRCRCGMDGTKHVQSIKGLEKRGMPVLCRQCVNNQISGGRTKHGHAAGTRKHASSTYSTWESMWRRCDQPSHKSYADYGGRGIQVDPVWRDFSAFLRDMGQRPTGMTLGRINNDLGYSPTNCQWETMEQQQRNRRSNRLLTLDGVTKTAIEWAETVGLPQTAIYKRLQLGWSDRDVILKPRRAQKTYRITGKAA